MKLCIYIIENKFSIWNDHYNDKFNFAGNLPQDVPVHVCTQVHGHLEFTVN